MNRIQISSIPARTHEADGLEVYTQLSEGQLKHLYEPDTGLFIAESPKVIRRALDAGYEPVSFLVEERYVDGEDRANGDMGFPGMLRQYAEAADLPVFTAPQSVLETLTGYYLTSGALCAMRRRPLLTPAKICQEARRVAVLERVVNPTNLGAIIRSAAALGMDAILLSPDCSDPLYRRAIRVSMGNVFLIPWTYIGRDTEDWYQNGIQMLRDMGFHTAAMALRQDTAAVNDPKFRFCPKLALVLGSEGSGLAAETIAACDDTIKIPMANGVDSLNVATAAAIAFWALAEHPHGDHV